MLKILETPKNDMLKLRKCGCYQRFLSLLFIYIFSHAEYLNR